MEINISPDIPFIYKQISEEPFAEHYEFKKDLIGVTPDGYLGNHLLDKVLPDLLTSNTVVINCGVGQGKSYSVIEIAKEYLCQHSENIIPVIAVPYLSLIPQYLADLNSRLPTAKVFSYDILQKESSDNVLIDPADYDAHILTVNGLLQNPGESALFQAKRKREYFENLRKHCENTGKKLVIFYDEMHAAVSNFAEDNIISLWNFKDLILKNFIVSATFNEASVELIQYLSEFTNNTIHVIESERKRIPEKRSDLKLIINDLSYETPGSKFSELLEHIKKEEAPFDIIHFSKKASIRLKENLIAQYGFNEDLIHLSVAEADIKYNHEKNNIGTSFSTGVSIKKENHHLIIFLPPDSLKNNEKAGIFTGGSDIVIQAMARQRNPGKIFVFISTPLFVKEHPFANFECVDNLQNSYSDLVRSLKYLNPKCFRSALQRQYEKYKEVRQIGLAKIEDTARVNMNALRLKPFPIFVLENSEQILNAKYFDGWLSTFTFFTAITDNFLNCKLTNIVANKTIEFTEDNLANELRHLYRNISIQASEGYISGDMFNNRDFEIVHNFNILFSKRIVKFNGRKAGAKQYATIYMSLLMLLKDGSISKININLDQKVLISKYVLANMKYAASNIAEEIDLEGYPDEYKELLFHYRKLYELREMTKNSFVSIGDKNNLSQSINSIPPNIDVSSYIPSLDYVMNFDPIFKNNIFSYKNTYDKNKGNLDKLKTWFYSTFILGTFQNKRVLRNTYYQFTDLEIDIVASIFNLSLEPFDIYEY